jgi:hypothetical protein
MAAIPVIINGTMFPKGKGADDKPVPAVFCGYLSIEGLQVGGGPVVPPDGPTPPDPPIDVPPDQPGPSIAVVIKPAPVTGGWGLAGEGQTLKWFYMPPQGGAGPKQHR